MATLKQRLHRKNASGTYDTVHLESESGMILRPSGRTVEQDLTDFLPRSQNTDDVPQTLTKGKLVLGNSRVFAGCGSGVRRIANLDDIPAQYTHPVEKQCTGGNCATVNGYTIIAQTNDPGVGSALTTGKIVLVYE